MVDQSLEELKRSGVELTYVEAVAIAQELITSPVIDGSASPSAGPPSLANVRISPDGSVEIVPRGSALAVPEIGKLLQTMLPRGGNTRVPGSLRYTIARALQEVDAPPFVSLAAFSASLARHENGDRAEVVRRLYARAESVSSAVALEMDRRRRGASATDLRRHLREADQALFQRAAPTRAARESSPRAGFDSLVLHRDPVGRVPPRKSSAAQWVLGGAVAALLAFGAGYAFVARGQMATRASQTVSLARSTVSPSLSRSSVSPPASSAASAETPPGVGTSGIASPILVTSAAPTPAASSAAVVPASTARSVAAPDGTASLHEASPVRAAVVSTGPTFSPAFAPNGTALFFHTGGASDGRSSLQAANLNGDDRRAMTILDDGANNYHVRPSPDGTRVAFDSNRDGERAVYVANRDGSDAHRVSGAGFAAIPTWSPDGANLAFIRAEPDRPQVWNIWLLNFEAAEMRRLTAYRFGQTWTASWLPDGRHICYTHEDRLIVRDLDGHSIREYPTPVAHSLVRTPAVSPDGRHVMFQVAGSGAWLLDLRDGSVRCVLSDPTAEEFAWSPDGRRVAFHSRRDGEWRIWLMTPS